MGEPVLIAKDLSISFGGIHALRDVDLTIGTGEIRCLVGENGSGKSTFVKVVSGVYTPDGGEVYLGGEQLTHHDPREAIAAGVQVIYQDLSLFDHMTVAENIAINLMLGRTLVDRRQMRRIATEQLAKMNVELDLDAWVSSLSVANKQLVAIARALSMEAKLLFLDEPTTALTSREVAYLLQIVRGLKDKGLAIVFISHKLDEVFDVADTITVFRDGRKVGDFAASELDEDSLAYHMTGRKVAYPRYRREQGADDGAPILKVSDLSDKRHFRGVSFEVRSGDIVGLTGLLGSGRTELALSLFGLNRPASGTIELAGRPVSVATPADAVAHGLALVPEDRVAQGLFMKQSMERNFSSTDLGRLLGMFRLLSPKKEREYAIKALREAKVNNQNVDAVVSDLSGGNAQKVVIGKWVATEPKVFILDSPSVGIDVGSKSEIYGQIQQMARAGMGILLISDEPEEIVANCNRILVMHEGSIIGDFDEEDVAAAGFRDRLVELIANPESTEGTESNEGTESPESAGPDGTAAARELNSEAVK